MSHPYDFDDELPWNEHVKEKQKNKKIKPRRRDSKRRSDDEHAEVEYLHTKWR